MKARYFAQLAMLVRILGVSQTEPTNGVLWRMRKRLTRFEQTCVNYRQHFSSSTTKHET